MALTAMVKHSCRDSSTGLTHKWVACRTKSIVQAAVQKRNSEALSAMTFAATLGDVDSMEHLLQRGLLINTADYDGRTTLHLAALEGNVKVLELLLQEGADPNVRDRQVCLEVALSKTGNPTFLSHPGWFSAHRHSICTRSYG